MFENYNQITHILYVIIAIITAIYLGQNMYKYGEPLLKTVFKKHTDLVNPINNILLTGFYLLNIGAIVMYLSVGKQLVTIAESIEFLFIKLGTVYLVLGVIHLFNITTLMKLKNNIKL